MEEAPDEVLSRIFSNLEPATCFNASLTCTKWSELISPNLPVLHHLHVNLDSAACNGSIIYRTSCNSMAAICQCAEHSFEQNLLLKEAFLLFGRQLHSLIIEDSLFSKRGDELVNDYPIYVILRECGPDHQLRSVEFVGVDMRRIRVWTLAVLARFTNLTCIHFAQCHFPEEMNESLLLRMLSSSLATVEQLLISDSLLVSDRLARTLARKCPRLRELYLEGCANVTALSVVAFCEYTPVEDSITGTTIRTLDFRRTAFDSTELSRHLANPLLKCGPRCWHVQSLRVSLGYDRPAVVLENTKKHDLVMMVFV